MARLRTLIACLMLALTLWAGAAAHASEALQCLDAPTAESAAHFEGDGDEVPADGQDPAPHHHGGCSGHSFAVPPTGKSVPCWTSIAASFAPGTSEGLPALAPDPALRPPIA